MTPQHNAELIQKYVLTDNLATYDHYDIWTCRLGFNAKRLFNRHRYLATPLVGALTLFDRLPVAKRFYPKREYPIVRATAVQTLLNLYRLTSDENCLTQAKKNLEWLLAHRGQSESGAGWGVLIPRTVSRTVEYPATMCYSTITPYVLEAFQQYVQATQTNEYDWIFPKFREFFQKDIKQMRDTETEAAYSYGTFEDRIEYNSNCYCIYCRSLLCKILNDFSDRPQIDKIYRFICNHQREDGSWFYSYSGKNSFIDCFHSCFNLKNLVKANRVTPWPDVDITIKKGWNYIKNDLFDANVGLFRRFSIANKPGVVKFDLYDNAEALNLAVLLRDFDFAKKLNETIQSVFVDGTTIYSRIDLLNRRYCPDYLRWAVVPYLYALSVLMVAEQENSPNTLAEKTETR